MLKKQNGITLIALIVTIIVLLILAGVSIAMITGENGIATKATASKTKTAESGEKESVSMAVSTAVLEGNGKIISTEAYKVLNEELEKAGYDRGAEQEDGTYSKDITSLPTWVQMAYNKYYIDEYGNVTEIEEVSEETLIKELEGKNIGDKYTLNNIEYVVVDKNDSKVTLISSTPLGSVTLGIDDETVVGENDIEKAVNSYNNAFNKIQKECEKVTLSEILPEICSVRSAVAYEGGMGNFVMGTFNQDGQYASLSNDVEIVNNYVNTEKTSAWYLSKYNGFYGPEGTLGVLSTKSINDYGSVENQLLKFGPPDSSYYSIGETVNSNVEVTEVFSEAYSHTYGVIPIITVDISE